LTKQNKFVLGLTGNSGAGKTSAGKMFALSGFSVIDCDKAAHVALAIPQCIEEVTTFFGLGIVINGKLDRRKIAEIIFSDKEKKSRYLDIVFPYVISEIAERVRKAEPPVLLDAPTLYESGLDVVCDRIIAVICSPETSVARITVRDDITEEAARLRLESGKTSEFFHEHADFVIENNGEYADFEEELNKFISKWRGEKGK